MGSGIDVTVEKLIVPTVKVACGFKVDEEELVRLVGFAMAPTSRDIMEKVSFWLIDSQGNVLKCRICDRGPFTKKGLFLHLTRIHQDDIRALIGDELRRALRKVTHAGPQ